MFNWFTAQSHVVQALGATVFTWLLTAIGALAVFLFKGFNRRLLDGMLGFAAGVMVAASYWSLLAPAIEMSKELGSAPWVPPLIGFVLGAGFLFLMDKLLPHLHLGMPMSKAEGIHTSWQRSVLLVLAITLHNIPEGLAVGVAFGAVKYGLASASLAGATALAIGIGLQNLPEGTAVAVPLRREGLSRLKSFFFGQASGIVEPIAGVLGALAVVLVRPLLPYALSFAAGAMIYVVVEELIPESQTESQSDVATIGAIGGFAVMMTLDVALG